MNTLEQQMKVNLTGGGDPNKVLEDCVRNAQKLGASVKSAVTGPWKTAGGNGSRMKNASVDELGKMFGIDLTNAPPKSVAGSTGNGTAKTAAGDLTNAPPKSVAGSTGNGTLKTAAGDINIGTGNGALKTADINLLSAKLIDSGRSVANSLKSAADDAEKIKKQQEKEQDDRSKTRHVAAATFAGGMGAVTGLSALASPFALERFTKASADLGAVIGRDTLPYLNAMTDSVRFAADAWEAIPGPLRSAAVAGGVLVATSAGLYLAYTSETGAKLRAVGATLSEVAAKTLATGATIRAKVANLGLVGSLNAAMLVSGDLWPL